MNDKKKENDTARKILETAAQVFAAVGFEGARVDEIAKLANVNKATIYYHIGDKKVLYEKVLHNIFVNSTEQVTSEIAKAKTPEKKLQTYIRHIAKTVDTHPQMASIMLRELASGGESFPDVVARDIAAMLGNLTSILREGEKKGVFIKTSPHVVQMLINGVMTFYKASSQFRSNQDDFPGDFYVELDSNVTGSLSDEIERLIIKALKK